MLEPAGRTVMISGANRGVGKAIARHLLRLGYDVSSGGRDVEALTDALSGIADERLLCHHYDATAASDGEGGDQAWIAATLDRFGSIDVVINNAGVLDTSPLENLTGEALDHMLDVNLKAPLRMIQLTLAHLRASGSGRVVNIASLSGVRVAGAFAPGYAMSKHAVMALTEATKHAGWSDGVRVTAVCPGFIATDMIAELDEDQRTMVQPEDLAELVATAIALPNTASVAQLSVACRLEAHY